MSTLLCTIGWFIYDLTGQTLLFEDSHILMCSVFRKTVFHIRLYCAFAGNWRFLTGLNPLRNVRKTALHIKLSDLLSARKQQKRSLRLSACQLANITRASHCAVIALLAWGDTSYLSHVLRLKDTRLHNCVVLLSDPLSLHKQKHRWKAPNYNKMSQIKRLIILCNSLSSCFLKAWIERRFARHRF